MSLSVTLLHPNRIGLNIPSFFAPRTATFMPKITTIARRPYLNVERRRQVGYEKAPFSTNILISTTTPTTQNRAILWNAKELVHDLFNGAISNDSKRLSKIFNDTASSISIGLRWRRTVRHAETQRIYVYMTAWCTN